MAVLVGVSVSAELAPSAGAAASSVVVTATVPSATTLDASACQSGTAATSLGTVLPGSTAITAATCTLTWGSSNASSTLRAAQLDGRDQTMYRSPDYTLDTTWSGDGWDTGDYLPNGELPTSVAIDAAGRILTAGNHDSGGKDVGAVIRFTSAGALDTTFDGDGKQTFQIHPGENTSVFGIESLDDGRIAVSSHIQGPPYGNQAGITVLTSGGALDTSFDGDGTLEFSCGNVASDARRIAEDSAGRIVSVGAWNDGTANYAVFRALASGIVDPAFSGDGCMHFLPTSGDPASRLWDVAVDDQDRIVACGSVKGATDRTLVVRVTTTGVLDTTFSGDGQIELPSEQDSDDCVVEVLDNGRILVGARAGAANDHIYLARLTSSGALDPTFAGDGDANFAPIGCVASMIEEPTGDVVVLCDDGVQSVAARIAPDGTDTGTIPPTHFGPPGSWLWDATPDSDGRIVGVGPPDWTTVRLGTPAIPDFAGSWAGGGFGACLETLGAAGTPGGSPWNTAGASNCTVALTVNWHPVPSTVASGAVLATTAAPGVTTAGLRFGASIPAAAKAGTYIAPIEFSVIAP